MDILHFTSEKVVVTEHGNTKDTGFQPSDPVGADSDFFYIKYRSE